MRVHAYFKIGMDRSVNRSVNHFGHFDPSSTPYPTHHYQTTSPLPTLPQLHTPLHTVSYLTSYPSLYLLLTNQHPPQTSFSLHTPTTTTQPPTLPLLPYRTLHLPYPSPPVFPYTPLSLPLFTALPYPLLLPYPALPSPIQPYPVPFIPSPHPTHRHLLIYPAYPLPYSYISLVCHTLQLKTEYPAMMSEFIARQPATNLYILDCRGFSHLDCVIGFEHNT